MKLKKWAKVEVDVDVEFPFYFEDDLSDNDYSVLYGRITPSEYIGIRKTVRNGHTLLEITKEPVTNASRYAAYLTEKEYISSKEAFEKMYIEASEFLANLIV